ncbi:MAG: gliding motility-associated C-terminal domain-containing protein [Bacteroidales bacterium]|jgi:gliding motility-associated-like protein|nr:gliding motility-associated C-terminal domain-containing protein [Bacteroidales bacterium]
MRYFTSILLILVFAGFSLALADDDDELITKVKVNGSLFCDGQTLSVSYTVSDDDEFRRSNIFTAQLSNASGSFSSPINIGTLQSRRSGVINAIIPSGTAYGVHYRIRVISSSPVFTSAPDKKDLTIDISPSGPVAETTAQPTCAIPTGSVVLFGLPATGTWTLTRTPGGTTATGTGTSTTITGLAPGTYTFTVTNESGCVSPASGNVVINTQPAAPTANAGRGGNVCGLNYKFSAIVSFGTGVWTQTTGPGTSTFIPDKNTPDATVTVSAYGDYTYTWTETNNACTSSSRINVNFYEQPAANAGKGGNNCGLEFILGATPGIGKGTWTLVNGPGTATFSPNANTPNAKVTVSSYGSHTFQWTEVNGICSNSSAVSINFIRQSSANAGNGGDECDKDFILKAVPGAVPGIWTKVSGPGNAVFSPGANQANAKVTVSQFGSYDFAWTEVNNLCTSTDIIRVEFHDLPLLNAGADAAICEGGSIQLHAIGSGSFQWNPASLVSNQTISNPVATPVATSVLTVTLTDQWGCKNSDQVNIEVREQPVAIAGPDQALEYVFETTLNAAALGNGQTGEWTIISGTGEFADINDNATSVSGLSPDGNSYKWTITNGVCLMSADTVNIIVRDLIIPTLITPNKDGKNEYFTIRGAETLGKTELVIFNKWGSRVYINSNYDNQWDGTDDNENPLPDDTYFYVLRPEKRKPVKGYIVVRH